MDNTIIVTGGAGFIGSNFILQWLAAEKTAVTNLDKLTYAGNLRNLRKPTPVSFLLGLKVERHEQDVGSSDEEDKTRLYHLTKS